MKSKHGFLCMFFITTCPIWRKIKAQAIFFLILSCQSGGESPWIPLLKYGSVLSPTGQLANKFSRDEPEFFFFNVSLKLPQKTHAVYDQKENRVTIALARAEQLSEMTFPPNKPRKRVYDCAS